MEIKLDSLSLEQCVIGCMISTPQNFVDGCETLTEEHFSSIKERSIFRILLEIYKSKPEFVDAVIIMSYAEQLNIECQGLDIEYITYIVDCSNIFKYDEYKNQISKILITKKFKTLLKQYSLNLNSTNIDESINNFIKIASNINQNSCQGKVVTIQDVLSGKSKNSNSKIPVLQQIQEIQNDKSILQIGTYQTGFYALDKIIGGLTKSNVIILGGRPAMGKTAFALNIAINLSKNSKCNVGIVSLEMSSEQLVYRMISCLSGIEDKNIKSGNINKDQYQQICSAIYTLNQTKIFLEDSFSVNLSGLKTTITSMKYKEGVDVVIIDYIQLINSDGRKGLDGNRNMELSEISRSLKLLARDLNIAILCLSQLSRKVEDRPDRRPRMSDIRDSGSIEQDADQILLMYRPSYYEELDNIASQQDNVFINVIKNRHGSTGTAVISFNKETIKFINIDSNIVLN